MRVMCSRECYSVSLGGLITGLLVFLAAFLVGVGAVRIAVALFLPDAEITSLRKSVASFAVQSHMPSRDVVPLEMVYDCSFPKDGRSVGVFTITNVGSEIIHLDVKRNGQLKAYFCDATGTTDRYVPARATIEELVPGDSGVVLTSMPLGAMVYEFSFDYSIGPRHLPRNVFGSAGTAFRPCVDYSDWE